MPDMPYMDIMASLGRGGDIRWTPATSSPIYSFPTHPQSISSTAYFCYYHNCPRGSYPIRILYSFET